MSPTREHNAPLQRIERPRGITSPERSTRLPTFIGSEDGAESVLDALVVVVVGSGSVGLHIVEHLARLQVAGIQIVDPARFKEESLLTHPIDREAFGRPKAKYAAKRARSISPGSRVEYFIGTVQELPLAAFAGASLLVLATDNLTAERDVGERAALLGIPLVQGSVHGESLTAQVRFFGSKSPASPCPACGFSTHEWRDLERSTVYACDSTVGPDQPRRAPSRASDSKPRVPPTRSPSSLCAMAASLVIHQILRHLLRLGSPVEDTLLTHCGYKPSGDSTPLRRREDCPLPHTRHHRVHLDRPPATYSLAEMAQLAGLDPQNLPEATSFAVGDRLFVEQATCCGVAQTIRRFTRPGGQLGNCSECHRALRAEPFFTRRSAGPRDVDLERPLSALGATGVFEVTVSDGTRTFLLFESP